jgi:hypothetical protein
MHASVVEIINQEWKFGGLLWREMRGYGYHTACGVDGKLYTYHLPLPWT